MGFVKTWALIMKHAMLSRELIASILGIINLSVPVSALGSPKLV
jgi:hypothetical protein